MIVIAEVVPTSPGIVAVIVTIPAAAGRKATPPVATLVGVLELSAGICSGTLVAVPLLVTSGPMATAPVATVTLIAAGALIRTFCSWVKAVGLVGNAGFRT
jgi:hypothetical protein